MSYFKTGSAANGNASRWGMQYPRPHHGMVAEYQCSGIPFVTCSAYMHEGVKRSTMISDTTPEQINFPYVTRWVEVKNVGHGDSVLKCGFTSNGVKGSGTSTGQSCFILSGSETTGRLEIKCKSMFFLADSANTKPPQFQIIAALTNIHKDDFPILSGSTGVEGVG